MEKTINKIKTANKRAQHLKLTIADYLEVKDTIPTGYDIQPYYLETKNKILTFSGANEDDWQDWRWQMKNRITDPDILSQYICLTDEEKNELRELTTRFRWATSPYYLALMDPNDPNCPVRKQTIPSSLELSGEGKDDPMDEEFTSPAPAITRRYPDRLIINVTNQCAMFCRHCQRRRNFGEQDCNTPIDNLKSAIEYIKENTEIRDVLITGGDALLLPNETLDWLLTELDDIPHVEIKRLGTRTLVTLPQRIDESLCSMLEKHHPIYINTQFNHSKEITPEVAKACDMLMKAGIPLGNQSVLLKGINNDPFIMKKLCQELLKVRIKPYYIFHAKSVKGTTHFGTSIQEGMDIIEKMRGFTSGLAVPTYIVNAPKGYGKTPILPQYLLSWAPDKVLIRTWEKRILEYENFFKE